MKQKKLIIEEEDEFDVNAENDNKEVQEHSSIIEWGDGSSNPSDFKLINNSSHYDDENYRYFMELNEKLNEIFGQSRWIALNPDKKVPKDLIPMIFQDLFEGLEETQFTYVEKFVTICDYMKINYNKAYECIHMKYKEKIVLEMEQKYKVLTKKKIKKIF